MPQDLSDDKSTLVQVMACCRQATSHYLNQRWPRSPTPYGVTRPQWFNSLPKIAKKWAYGNTGGHRYYSFPICRKNRKLPTHGAVSLRWLEYLWRPTEHRHQKCIGMFLKYWAKWTAESNLKINRCYIKRPMPVSGSICRRLRWSQQRCMRFRHSNSRKIRALFVLVWQTVVIQRVPNLSRRGIQCSSSLLIPWHWYNRIIVWSNADSYARSDYLNHTIQTIASEKRILLSWGVLY